MRSNSTSVSNSGLTLIEVVLAVAVLAIGLLGVFAMQSVSLRANHGLQIVQIILERAEEELSLQRATFDVGSEPEGPACLSVDPGTLDAECTVEVFYCDIGALAQASCQESDSGNAYLVIVRVEALNTNHVVELQRVLGERPFHEDEGL